jgi:homoserine kinase
MSDQPITYSTITVFAPATVANVGCGYDAMGFALDAIGDEVTLERLPANEKNMVIMTGHYGHLIPTDWDKNTASVSVQAYLDALQIDIPLKLTIKKNLPLGSGMGSSAASAAAAVKAIDVLLGGNNKDTFLLPFAMEGERVACGTAHADNVAPALFGGFMLIRSYTPLDVVQVHFKSSWQVVVCHPDTVLKTADSRQVVQQEIHISKAIQQSANAAALMLALMNQDVHLMKKCLHDELAEPRRVMLIPDFEQIKESVLTLGAFNCNISGSGPSLFSICENEAIAERVGKTMQQKFAAIGLASQVYQSSFVAKGAHVISSKS